MLIFQSCQSKSLDIKNLNLAVQRDELKQEGLVSTVTEVGIDAVQYTMFLMLLIRMITGIIGYHFN